MITKCSAVSQNRKKKLGKNPEILNKLWILVNDNMNKQKPKGLNAFAQLQANIT